MDRVRVMPAWIYQRYSSFFDRLAPSLGMALVFFLTAQATGAFPQEWRVFIASGVLVAGLIAPVAGYVLFILALVFPLYSISIYVAALALAVMIPLAFFVARYLTVIIMVLAVPLLVPYRITLVVPLLAGLWWAEWGGALAGLGSALWLKLFVGMCGIAPYLTQLGGQSLPVHQLIDRFSAANSLQTLLWLMDPFAPGSAEYFSPGLIESPVPDSYALLFHVLEIAGWGLAGYGVGLVRQRMENMARPNVGLLASVSAGFLGVWLGSLLVPMALGLLETLALPTAFLSVPFLVECGVSGVIAIGLYKVSRYLTRPAVLPSPSPAELHGPSPHPSSATGEREESAHESTSHLWEPPQPRDDEQADIIMIELD